MTIPRSTASGLFLLSLSLGFAADADLKPVFVGVGERVTSFERPNQRIVPTPIEPQFYLAEHLFPTTKPPEWIMQWVASDLSARGYLVADAKLPAVLLTFAWGTVDSRIDHVGRPLQKLDPRGQRIYDWRETKYERGEAPPFCVITAYDIADFSKPMEKRTPLWRAEMWTVFIRPRPQAKVEIGPVVFKEYGVAPKPAQKETPAAPHD